MKNVTHYQKVTIPGDFNPGESFILPNGTMFVLVSVGSSFPKINDVNTCTTKNPTVIFYTSVVEAGGLRDDVKYPSRERFYFVIDDNGFLVPPNISKSRTDNINDCKRQYIERAYGNYGYVECSTVIIKDGWKISKDYPW